MDSIEVQKLFQEADQDCCCGQKLKEKKLNYDEKVLDRKVKNGHTRGTLAAKSGCFSCVGHLMKQGNNPNDSYNANGSTMLHYASLNGRPKIVKLLMYAKADVNRPNRRSRTALHEASTTGHSEVVKILLEHQADVMSKNKYGRTTLHVATKYNNIDVIDLLIQHRQSQLVPAVTAAVEKYPIHCQLLKPLIYMIVDFTCAVAAQQDVCFCAQDLEDNDIRQDRSIFGNEHGHTVATKAAVSGCVKCCTWLIRCGLDIDKPATDDGSSMLYCAVYKLRTACVRLLCEHGADVNKQNTRKRIPIRTAVKTSNADIVKALCDHGADLSLIRHSNVHPKLVDLVQFYQVTNRMISQIQNWVKSHKLVLLSRQSIDVSASEVNAYAKHIINLNLNTSPLAANADVQRVWDQVKEIILQLRLESQNLSSVVGKFDHDEEKAGPSDAEGHG